MTEINWIALAYILIGIFAMSGFFKGWWKEAITTFFLVFLVILLQMPALAQIFIDLINLIFATITRILPDSINIILADILETMLGVETTEGTIHLDGSDGGTWLVILLLFIGLAIFIGRSRLPGNFRLGMKGSVYIPALRASLLGALIGGFNGLLIVNLVREYLDGRNLPGSATELARAGSASSRGVIQAVDVPTFTILDSFLPWVFIILGILVFLTALNNRVVFLKDKDGFRKIDYKVPLGHKKV